MIRHPRSVRTQDEVDLQFDIAESIIDDASPEDTTKEFTLDIIRDAVSSAYNSSNHKSKEYRINAIAQKVFDVVKTNRSNDTSYELGVAATISWLFCEDYYRAPFDVGDTDIEDDE